MDIVIVGAGDVGFHLAKLLALEKHNITIIDRDPQKTKRARDHLDAMVVEGHGASLRVLKEARVDKADIFAALTNNDEVNLMACQLAKKMGNPSTVARVRNPEYTTEEFILTPEELGVETIIHPEKETADAVVRLIRQSSATDVLEFAGGKIQLMGIRLEQSSQILRIPLKELLKKYGEVPMRVVAIKRKERTLIPRGDDILAPGDQIFLICAPEYIPEILKLTGKSDTRIENIMILGGGLIGQFVAKTLEGEVKIKIIESNAERSLEIADILPRTLIIHGDGTDLDLLVLEGIMDMDAFIAVTGDDETNIISTLVARHLRVPRTIALVNKVEYLPITPTIGMDAVVSKQLLTVNAVQRFIRQRTVASIATIPGLDAEIIEYIVGTGSRITRKKLRETNFPRNAIVGAVIHETGVEVPTGDTHILPGDKVVIFTLPQAFQEVEKFFENNK